MKGTRKDEMTTKHIVGIIYNTPFWFVKITFLLSKKEIFIVFQAYHNYNQQTFINFKCECLPKI